uniref:PH domain-containing protein n=1 Tax=Macrostomum lignano TaxID=282301 RepID=A0A1I8H6E3_9PLAT
MSQDSPALDRHSIETGLGSITWWGFSPALDLQQVWLDANRPEPAQTMLIVGSGDQRHLLTTLARLRRHCTSSTPLKIFVLETDCSLYCRAMLQLLLCLDTRASVQERAELFLELYGNTLVREQTVDHVTRLCPMLIRLVTDPEFCQQTAPMLQLGDLKFRERDIMEAVFKFWKQGLADRKGFDAQLCWDLRLRQHLGVRYDAIPNVFDWDHQMRLVERPNGAQVSRPEYLHWRTKGVAFRLREAAYDASNRTLCSGIVLSVAGERHARRGYWGDIVCSPYLGWGLVSEWPDYDRSANGQRVNSVGAVCEYNVCSVMHELSTGTRYEQQQQQAEGATATVTEIIEEETEEAGEAKQDDSKVEKLPESSDKGDAKFRGQIQLASFSNSTAHLLADEGVAQLFSESAVLVVESALYMLELRQDQVAQFADRVATFAASIGAKPLRQLDPEKDAHLRQMSEEVPAGGGNASEAPAAPPAAAAAAEGYLQKRSRILHRWERVYCRLLDGGRLAYASEPPNGESTASDW